MAAWTTRFFRLLRRGTAGGKEAGRLPGPSLYTSSGRAEPAWDYRTDPEVRYREAKAAAGAWRKAAEIAEEGRRAADEITEGYWEAAEKNSEDWESAVAAWRVAIEAGEVADAIRAEVRLAAAAARKKIR